MTSARPEEILAIFPRGKAVGKAFGVVCLPWRGHTYEVATFRRDVGTADGRRPLRVEFTDEREDALRRDFTINGLFYDPIRDVIIDHVGGQADLEQRRVRAIGDPRTRFSEDHLRMLRAVRFASTLDFELDPGTEAAIRDMAPHIRKISAERVRDELNRILLESPRAGQGIRLLERTGLLAQVLPEVAAMAGTPQPPEYHPEGDVLTHTVMMLDLMRDRSVELAWAVLLHDVGKPATIIESEEPDGTRRLRFPGHAEKGAQMAEEILKRLRMPNRVVETVARVVLNHMKYKDVPRMRRATLRRLIGSATFPIELELHRLDCLASHGQLDHYEFLRRAQQEWDRERAMPKPLIRGDDLLAMGLWEGPELGDLLRRLYEAQLDHPDWGRSQLEELARREIEQMLRSLAHQDEPAGAGGVSRTLGGKPRTNGGDPVIDREACDGDLPAERG